MTENYNRIDVVHHEITIKYKLNMLIKYVSKYINSGEYFRDKWVNDNFLNYV